MISNTDYLNGYAQKETINRNAISILDASIILEDIIILVDIFNSRRREKKHKRILYLKSKSFMSHLAFVNIKYYANYTNWSQVSFQIFPKVQFDDDIADDYQNISDTYHNI